MTQVPAVGQAMTVCPVAVVGQQHGEPIGDAPSERTATSGAVVHLVRDELPRVRLLA